MKSEGWECKGVECEGGRIKLSARYVARLAM